MKVLGINDFFYVSDKSYDFLAEKALPYYHEAHKMLVTALCINQDQPFEVIDLGMGSGVTSAYILKNYSKAQIIGVDLFEEMLSDARIRLKLFGDRVTFAKSDNTVFLNKFDRKVDAIVSAFCIHHLDEAGKKELFNLIYDRLLPNGHFLMLDLTTFNDICLRDKARRTTIDHMTANIPDEAYRKKWIHHWNNINVPSSSDDMVAWLNTVGFKAETIFRNNEISLISAILRAT